MTSRHEGDMTAASLSEQEMLSAPLTIISNHSRRCSLSWHYWTMLSPGSEIWQGCFEVKKSHFALKKLPNTNLLPLKSCNQELRVYAGFKASVINDSSNFDVVPIRDLTPSSERGCSDQPRNSLHPWVSRQSHSRVGIRGDIMQITWTEDGGTADVIGICVYVCDEVMGSALVFDWLTEKGCESSLNILNANYTF